MLSAGHDPGELQPVQCLQPRPKLRGEAALGGKEQQLCGRQTLEGAGVPGEERRKQA